MSTLFPTAQAWGGISGTLSKCALDSPPAPEGHFSPLESLCTSSGRGLSDSCHQIQPPLFNHPPKDHVSTTLASCHLLPLQISQFFLQTLIREHTITLVDTTSVRLNSARIYCTRLPNDESLTQPEHPGRLRTCKLPAQPELGHNTLYATPP